MGVPLVLAVEDHPIEQRLLSMLAVELGLDMSIASSAIEAIDAFRASDQIGLVLMDLSMPGDTGQDMDGLQCAREIRKLEIGKGRRVPIIAVTAHAMLGDRTKCINAGMDDYLSKPFTYDQFKSKVFQWLEATD